MASLTAQILSELADDSSSGESLGNRLVATCARRVGVSGVGIMLMTIKGPAGMLAASDDAATTMEDLQFSLGEGPCVDASTYRRPMLHPDLASSGPGRWPVFCDMALQAGIRAAFAFPLRAGAIHLGVLDLYRTEPGPLSGDQVAMSLAFADAATAVLLRVQGEDRSPVSDDELTDVIGQRAVVHQATGYLSIRAGVSLSAALSLLRSRAFSTGRPITEVAQHILDGTANVEEDSL